jgi:hypothetical protein
MSTKGRGFLLAAGILGSILAGAAPVLAQSHGGGGGGGHGGGGGGGGHASSGGGHSSGGGGGHAYAGGGHYGGGGGPHYAAAGHYAGGGGYSHGYGGGFHGSAYGGYRGGSGAVYGHSGGYGHTGGYYGHSGGYYGHGYSTGAYWRGGYWHGGFWPRCYYGVGFSWFLPILPLAYATYWWGGVPYYYANDVYYTYPPDYEGYVATDPPPVAESGAAADGAAPTVGAPPGGPAPGDGGAAAGQIFMYPKNGQSAEQQATDKTECQQWAQQQAGTVAQNGSDYQRAMTACVEGRGYSAR